MSYCQYFGYQGTIRDGQSGPFSSLVWSLVYSSIGTHVDESKQ